MKPNNCVIIVFTLLSVLMLINAARAVTTDAELEELEQQIEQQEKAQAEANRKAEAEVKRKAEEEKLRAEEELKRREEEEQRAVAEAERKRMEDERLQAEKVRQETNKKYFAAAEQYMNEDKFELAIQEYQKILDVMPEDARALEAISKAQKYLTACNEFVGSWYVEPNGITWQVHPDHTIFGKWLVFSSNGFWECASPRDREFVTSWPDCPVCNTDYFILSDDGKTIQGIRNSTAMHGRRLGNSR